MTGVTGRLYISPYRNPTQNLALERFLLRTGARAILLWRPCPAVVVGRHQDIESEVNTAYAERADICVVRRSTGGGAVYMDEGNLNICAVSTAGAPRMGKCIELLSEILRSFGVPAEFSGGNDVTVDGRKISGWAETMCDGVSMAHGTLLFDVALDTLAEVLTPPREKYEKHGVASVRQRVANLKDHLPGWNMEKLIEEISAALEANGYAPAPIPEHIFTETSLA